MLPHLIALLIGLPQQPPEAYSPVVLRPAVVVEAEPAFEGSTEVDAEAKPEGVKERPAPARKASPKAPKKAKTPASPKRTGRS